MDDAIEQIRTGWLARIDADAYAASCTADRWRARAAAIEGDAARAPLPMTDWVVAITEASVAASAERARGTVAVESYVRATLARLELLLGPDEDVEALAADAQATLHEADPAFDPSAPEYALRTPWAPAARPVALAPPDDTPAPEPPAHAADMAAAHDPLVAHQGRVLGAASTLAGLAHADACFAIEADWNVLLHAALLLPWRAALRGTTVTADLVGAASALLDTTHGARLLDRAGDPEPVGAFAGEAALDWLRDARDHLAAHPGEDLRTLVSAHLDAGSSEAAGPLQLWGRPVSLDSLHETLTRPPRPGV